MAASLRILCLHDAHSDAALLKNQLTKLANRLYEKHGKIDFVYINSPLVASTGDGRVWWEEDVNQKIAALELISSGNEDKNEHENTVYQGLDASLLLLQQVWTSTPFWGIIGVGQGAAVGALLTLTLQLPPHVPPSFLIFAAAAPSLLPNDQEQQEQRLCDIPCLHLQVASSPSDGSAATAAATDLIPQFGGTVVEISHLWCKAAWNAMGRFICHQRQQFLSDDRNQQQREITALQTALHLTELQASNVIANHIMENPPGPLMAVIRPQAVAAGWGGRRQPGEEGGGAPCPSEFLLQREKRQGKGVSRVHPNNQNDSH